MWVLGLVITVPLTAKKVLLPSGHSVKASHLGWPLSSSSSAYLARWPESPPLVMLLLWIAWMSYIFRLRTEMWKLSIWASLISQLVKNPPSMRETPVQFLDWEEPWRRDRPPTPILGFPPVSASKESACNVGDLGSIPGLGKIPREGKGYPLQYSGLENSMDCYSPWGCKELDMTEWLSLTDCASLRLVKNLPVNAGNESLIPGHTDPQEKEMATPTQYSCLENPWTWGAWQATVHGVTKETDVTSKLNNSKQCLTYSWM